MNLDKVDTYDKAHTAFKADEHTTIHLKMITPAASDVSEFNAISSYKKSQKGYSQASQPQHGGHEPKLGQRETRGSFTRNRDVTVNSTALTYKVHNDHP
jgi:hypothetical protein